MSMLLHGPLPPLYQNTTSLTAAVSGGTLGVGYSAGGYLVAYFVGVSKVLQQLGIVKKGETKTAGSSAGGLAQLVDHPYGPSHDKFINGTLTFVDYCRSGHIKCIDHLDEAIEKLFLDLIDPSVPFDPNYDKRCTVFSMVNVTLPANVTKGRKLGPGRAAGVDAEMVNSVTGSGQNTQKEVVGTFNCKQKNIHEFTELMRTSVYVPGWSHPTNKYRLFNGHPSYDGAFVQPMPCPPNVTYCIKVLSVVPAEVQIYLRAFTRYPEYWASTLTTMREFLTEMINSDPSSMGNINWREWFGLFSAGSSQMADIYPGKYSKSPISPMETIYGIFTPPRPKTVKALYRSGQVDALMWAKEQGWPIPSDFKITDDGTDA